MTIKVSKPAINIREELADLKQDTGLKGQELMRADTVAEARTAIRAGRKNLIINGDMRIAQRGTSSTANGYCSLDRWYVNQSGGSTTFSQEENANPSETGGIKNYARLNVSSSSDWTGIHYRIEDVDSVPAGTITMSFWAKGTAPVGGLYIFGSQDFGTSGSADVDISAVLVPGTEKLTSSWTRYSMQLTIPSIDGKTLNAGSFLRVGIGQGADTSSTAYDLNITGIQLELGSVATEFEHRSYGEELALCQRYFYKSPATSSRLFILVGVAVTTGEIAIFPPVSMRTIPSAILNDDSPYWESHQWNTVGNDAIKITSVHAGHLTPDGGGTLGVFFSGTTGAYVTPNLSRGTNYGIATNFVSFDAEL